MSNTLYIKDGSATNATLADFYTLHCEDSVSDLVAAILALWKQKWPYLDKVAMCSILSYQAS